MLSTLGPGNSRKVCGFLLLLLAAVIGLNGCSRRFYRNLADKEANAIIAEKDRNPFWKVENFHLKPHPLARFYSPYDPDFPPMPPDDPNVAALAPNPQNPTHDSGVAWVEGDGYLQLLEEWNGHNRALQQLREEEEKAKNNKADTKTAKYGPSGIQLTAAQEKLTMPEKVDDGNQDTEKLPQPATVGDKKAIICEPGILPNSLKGPYLITLDQAVALGLINSRAFQTRREDLYLTALPVTLQRYSFAAQFFFTEEAVRERLGPEVAGGPANRWVLNTGTGFTKLFSTGALLVLQFANQTVINLTGVRKHTISVSDINLDLVQPLLRGGGKAVTLEPLTQTERDLVYELRSYARFRKEFYVFIAAGGGGVTSGNTPGFGGGVGIGAALGVRGGQVTPGGAGRVLLAAGGFAPAQGYLPTLLEDAILDNQKKNVIALEKNLLAFQAFEEGGQVEKIQVDQVELQLLQGRRQVLQQEQQLRTALDQFKQQLGIPVNLKIELDESPIKPITQQLRRYEEVIALYNDMIRKAEQSADINDAAKLRSGIEQLFRSHPLIEGTGLSQTIFERWQKWKKASDAELDKAQKSYRAQYDKLRIAHTKILTERAKKQGLTGKAVLSDAQQQELDRLSDEEEKELRKLSVVEMEKFLRVFEKSPWKDKNLPEGQPEIVFESSLARVVIPFSLIIIESRTERLQELKGTWPDLPPAFADGVNILNTDLDQAQDVAVTEALNNRLDLMNIRAALVDNWRQIAIFANSLMGVFNVRYHMDTSTPAGLAKPLKFDSKRTRHQLILNAELPLVRKSERNSYRASLIAFERGRRALMAAEDDIAADLRNQVRQLRLLAQNYIIQQTEVDLAYTQVEQAEEVFKGPPEPGQTSLNRSQAVSFTNQLLQAQSRLLNAQNNIFQTWINYLQQRLTFYRDLERMPINQRGVWIDELTNNNSNLPLTRDGAGDQRQPANAEQPNAPAILPVSRLGPAR